MGTAREAQGLAAGETRGLEPEGAAVVGGSWQEVRGNTGWGDYDGLKSVPCPPNLYPTRTCK